MEIGTTNLEVGISGSWAGINYIQIKTSERNFPLSR